jgi:hypothetical protein
MKKPLPTSVRLPSTVKVALETAAAADSRSTSSMIEKIVTDWLKKRGHLKAKM